MGIAAFWISPKGEIIDVKTNHISEVIRNPEKFGFNDAFIEYVYKFYNEKVGQEGKAREQLMMALFKNDWIRIRKYRDFWSINVKKFAGRAKSFIIDWAQKIIKGIHGIKEDDPYAVIKIDQEKQPVKSSDLKAIVNEGNLLPEFFIVEKTVYELSDIKPYDFVIETIKKMGEDSMFKKYMTESSLSRLWRHNLAHDCAALTAFRKSENCGDGEEYTKSDNLARNRSLLAKLKSMGYSVTSLKGKYPEGGNTGKEESFFVVDIKDNGNLLSDVKELGELFEQDSVLFIPKGAIDNKSSAFLIGTNHCKNNWLEYGKTEKFKKSVVGKESSIYTSMVNGRPFIFEEVGETINDPGNGMGWWSLDIVAKKHWSELVE